MYPGRFNAKSLLPLVLSSLATQVLAQATLEEVVVSARRTSEDLQSTPLAIDAIGERLLSERGISQAGDVAEVSASLIFDEGLVPTDTRPVIRSLSSSRGRANVATLIDGVDVSGESMTTGGGGLTANMRLLDLERVEVVKGPQSVMYGRSAFSGAIYYISKRPSEEFEAEVMLNAEEYNTSEAKISLSGPINERAGYRLNIASWDTDGVYSNPNSGDKLGDGDSLGAALAFQYQHNEVFGVYGRVEYSDDHYGPRAVVLRQSLLSSPPGNPDGFGIWHGVVSPHAENLPWVFDGNNEALCANPDNRAYPFFDNNTRGFCRPTLVGELSATEAEIDLSVDPATGKDFEGTDVLNRRGHVDLQWNYDKVTVQWLTAFTSNRSSTREDFDLTNFTLGDPGNPAVIQYGFSALGDISHEVKQLSQEFRVQGTEEDFNWYVSALIWDENHHTDWNDLFWLREGGFDVLQFFGQQTATSPNYATPTTVLDRDVMHKSLAASLSYALTSQLSVTVEGRFLHEEQKYFGTGEDRGASSATGNCDFSFNPLSSCPPATARVKDTAFVPRLGIDYQASEDLFIYGSYAEGFKPGGIDTLSANANITDGEFDSEKLQAVELGLKSELWSGKARLNLAAFYYRYTDQQQNVQLIIGGQLGTNVVNAGRTDVDGLEMDFQIRLTEALSATLGYVYADAQYVDFNLAEIAADAGGSSLSTNGLADAGNAEGDYSGKQVRLTAKHAATLNLRFEDELSEGMTYYLDLSGRYQSKRYISHGNRAWLPAHTIWDLSLGLNMSSWSVQAYVNNLLDDDSIRSGLGNPDYGFDATAQGGLSNGANLILPQPRTAGLRMTYRF